MLGLQMLIDMVTGQLGEPGEQNGAAAISRVILAGNLLSQNTQEKDASTKVPSKFTNVYFSLFKNICLNLIIDLEWNIFKPKYLTKKTQAGSVEAVCLLDELLLQLVVSLSYCCFSYLKM